MTKAATDQSVASDPITESENSGIRLADHLRLAWSTCYAAGRDEILGLLPLLRKSAIAALVVGAMLLILAPERIQTALVASGCVMAVPLLAKYGIKALQFTATETRGLGKRSKKPKASV